MSKEDELRIAVELTKALDATAQRLEEAYVRYVMLANAAGIAACLEIADALVNRKSTKTMSRINSCFGSRAKPAVTFRICRRSSTGSRRKGCPI
jgi:hypothetical protein